MIDEVNKDIAPVEKDDGVLAVRVVESKTTGLSLLPLVAVPLISIIGSISLVTALTVSMLFKREDLRNRLIRLAGQRSLTSTTRALDEGAQRISSYLIIESAINGGFGLVFGIGLALIGVDYAFLWGFLAAVLRFIPYVGTWLGGVFPLLISVAVSEAWIQPILVVGLLVLLGVVANNIVEPMLVSRSTGVSPIALVAAAAFWTWLWGPIGLILSTPMTVCLGVIGKYVPPLQFFDVLLGTEPALDPQAGYYQRLLARDEAEAAELVEGYLADHTLTELCDDVLVPALVRTREDFDGGELSQEDVDGILGATRDILDNQVTAEWDESAKPAVTILGYPARDGIDELALHLLQLVVGPCCKVETLATRMSAEVVARVKAEEPPVVYVAAVPPGGVNRVRYLCKRLRGQFPELTIAAGCWGLAEGVDKAAEQLRAAGASQVATSLRESREQLAPVLQVLPHLQTAAAVK
jgi:hypothetical protein